MNFKLAVLLMCVVACMVTVEGHKRGKHRQAGGKNRPKPCRETCKDECSEIRACRQECIDNAAPGSTRLDKKICFKACRTDEGTMTKTAEFLTCKACTKVCHKSIKSCARENCDTECPNKKLKKARKNSDCLECLEDNCW